ncbi:MOSC domain-containing protein [Cohnella xylanilytica]|uniref:MOSC domain-containing protein n=1 Tax=Cohnella xylanilytica TaxID=557555 RepID=UPI001FE4E9D0|nr:MOSC domain-containing protein [Cohnella xylanilytica]
MMEATKERWTAPLLSVNTGAARLGTYKGREAKSGIGKEPADRPLLLGPTGLEGDEQADLVNHGGPDKAVCVYSYLHYSHWEAVLGRKLPMGAFGENFTLDGISEDMVHVGDVFRVGGATVQISQPRVPCWKLAMRWGLDELPALVTQTGATGFYFRVLEPGEVAAGEIELVRRHPAGLSVKEANRIMHRDKKDTEGIRRLLAVEALADSWRDTLTKRLAKSEAEG